MSSVLDHLVVTAPNLAAGAAYIKETLGVDLQTGGAHVRMGTHNLLLSLGDSAYLEVIAIDPAAPKPPHPRWFALDKLLPNAAPRLAGWVARTKDIHNVSASWNSVIGNVEAMSRGTLEWLITILPDGSLPFGGAAPALIEWQTDSPPATRLNKVGCGLVEFQIRHPESAKLNELLSSIELAPPIEVESSPTKFAFLSASIDTPSGPRTLWSS